MANICTTYRLTHFAFFTAIPCYHFNVLPYAQSTALPISGVVYGITLVDWPMSMPSGSGYPSVFG